MSRDMVVVGLSLALVASVGEAATGQSDSIGQSSFDTAVYSDAQTAELIELARIHHRNRSLRLQGYRATIFTTVEGRIGASRFTGGLTLFQFETAARLHWQQPGDVRVDVLGARAAAPRFPGIDGDQMAGFWTESLSGEPWFVPASIGDRIQLMGIPDEDALHPLARDGIRFYRYSISDSMQIVMPGRTVRAVAVRVDPLVYPPTETLLPMEAAIVVDGLIARDAPTMSDEQIAALIGEIRSAEPGSERRQALADSLNRSVSFENSRVRVNRSRDPRVPSLVSGEMWLDADSLDVVRLMVTFVGENIWDDDEDSPALVSLEADLEYGLHLNEFWLPHRQLLAATFQYKYLPGAKLPATAVTTFSDYELAVDSIVRYTHEFEGGDTRRRHGGRWRCEPFGWDNRRRDRGCGDQAFIEERLMDDGTRWQVTVPTIDSLQRYDFEADFENHVSVATDRYLQDQIARLARLSEELPSDVTGQRTAGVDWLAAGQAFHFNRVQGPSLGLGYQWSLPVEFTTLHMDGRVSFGDRRVTGGVTWRKDAPEGRADYRAFYEILDVEPWTRGLTLGNSLRALFIGHDNADYYLAAGGGVAFTGNHGLLNRASIVLRFEHQEGVRSEVGSGIDDFLFGTGRYPPNPPIAEGNYLRARLTKDLGLGPLGIRLGFDGLTSTHSQGARWWGSAELPFSVDQLSLSLRAHGGALSGDELPQLLFRAGGPWTVRAYDYGTRRGSTLWAVQADVEWVVSQWWSPVLFADVGNVDTFENPLVGGGVAVSLLSGWLRFDLAKGLTPSSSVRFDVVFRIPMN